MTERFIVLNAPESRTSTTVFLGGVKAGKATRKPAGLHLRVDEIDRAAVSRVAGDRTVKAVAPAMPMRLIGPVASKKTGRAKPAPADWGIRAVGAAGSPFTGGGIVVAVLDTGIDPKHAAFKGVKLTRQNFTSDPDDSDLDGHGTHCAGTIFGRNVSGTRIGVARGVNRALIGKVIGEDGVASDVLARALQWAVNEGANVISMSLGFDFPGYQREMIDLGLPPELATSRALEGYRLNVRLFESLVAQVKAMAGVTGIPCVIVAAAGNESRTDTNPEFKIAVSPPAVADGVISVAALGESPKGLVVAPFSNTGALISGPGVDVTSAKVGGGLVAESGTSMAAPHVAGVAALWAEKLAATGALTTPLLVSRLVASGSTDRLRAGFAPGDVGSGMVTAPAK
jgi:subtilisin family serine protease